jgi:hypothetical protein
MSTEEKWRRDVFLTLLAAPSIVKQVPIDATVVDY